MKIQFSGSDDEFLNCNTIEILEEEFNANNLNTLNKALLYIYKTETRAHKSFFKSEGILANGTICLVDEMDSEIKEDPVITHSSEIVLISTLHGG